MQKMSPDQLDDSIAVVFECMLVSSEEKKRQVHALAECAYAEMDKLSPGSLIGTLEYVLPDRNLFIPTYTLALLNISKRKTLAINSGQSKDEINAYSDAAAEVVSLSRVRRKIAKQDRKDLSGMKHPTQFSALINSIIRFRYEQNRSRELSNNISALADDLSPEEALAICNVEFSPLLNTESTNWSLYPGLANNYLYSLELEDTLAIAAHGAALVALGHSSIVEVYEGWRPDESKAGS